MSVLLAVPRLLLAFYAANEFPGIFIFLLIEEAGVPLLLPGDTLLIAAGARADRSLVSALLVILTATAAVTIGSSVLYAIVRRGGRPLLDRYGRFIHLNEGRVVTLEKWFRRHGARAIVAGRLIPGLRTPTTVMAGIFDVPYRTFAPSTALAAVVWSIGYFLLGRFLDRQRQELAGLLIGDIDEFVAVIVGLVVLVMLFGLVRWGPRRIGVRSQYGTNPDDSPPRAGNAEKPAASETNLAGDHPETRA